MAHRQRRPAIYFSYEVMAFMLLLIASTSTSDAFLVATAAALPFARLSVNANSVGRAGRTGLAQAYLSRQLLLSAQHKISSVTGRQRCRNFNLKMAQTAENLGQQGTVTIYFKEGCPHCEKAFALLEGEYKLHVSKVNILEGDDSGEKIKQMKTFSRRSTVPQIFFNSEHIGGNDDLHQLHEVGKLPELVAQVRMEKSGMMRDSWYHPWY